MSATELAAIVVTLSACGRIGFDESARSLDATVVVPDGDALGGCAQPAPFLYLIDVVEPGNPSTQIARYCYAGLAGPLNASIRMLDDSAFAQATGPIEPGMIDIFIGSPNCFSCFVRLAANGVVFDGPVRDFIGE